MSYVPLSLEHFSLAYRYKDLGKSDTLCIALLLQLKLTNRICNSTCNNSVCCDKIDLNRTTCAISSNYFIKKDINLKKKFYHIIGQNVLSLMERVNYDSNKIATRRSARLSDGN